MTDYIEDIRVKLSAYVLGELDEDAVREIEAALAGNEELRAECEQLRQTVGLVQASFPAGERLAEGALERIMAAAETSAPPVKAGPGFVAPLFKAAAVIGFVALGVGVYRAQAPEPEGALARMLFGDAPAETIVAQRENAPAQEVFEDPPEEGPDARLAEARRGREDRVLHSLGYTEGTGGSARDKALGVVAKGRGADLKTYKGPGDSAPPSAGGRAGGSAAYDGPASVPSVGYELKVAEPGRTQGQQWVGAIQTEAGPLRDSLQGLEGLGYTGGGGSSNSNWVHSISEGSRSSVVVTSTPSTPGAPGAGPANKSRYREKSSSGSAGGPSTPGPNYRIGADRLVRDEVGGSDDFYLGQGGRVVMEANPCGLIGLRVRGQAWTRQEWVQRELQRLLDCCRPYPRETPRDMYFRYWGDNPFELTTLDALSTFAADVDTASFVLARRYLKEGKMPTKEQIRTEEFLNYFTPDLAPPTEGPLAIHTELAPSRFGGPEGRWMLRVGLRGREIQKTERQPVALTFVIDTSGSMKQGGRMDLVKYALRLLVAELDANDQIALVAFNNNASQVLPMTSVASRGLIEAAIHGLQPNGSTNAEAGLMMGYAIAAQHVEPTRHSRVVMLSDGVANVGETNQNRIAEAVREQRRKGVYLNTVGVGMNNHNDVFLEQMANNGDGICNYVDDEKEAKRALVDRFTGAFQVIARDVKIQVEFDKTQVYRYRLLGYENRAVADADFRNDTVDAGEMGAGHQVTALYELELTNPGPEARLGTVRVRWQQPRGAAGGNEAEAGAEDSATEIESPVSYASGIAYEATSAGYRRAVIVAQLAEVLRRSQHAKDDSLDDLVLEFERLAPHVNDEAFQELAVLVAQRKELIRANLPVYDELAHCLDRVRFNHYMNGVFQRLPQEHEAETQQRLREIEQRQNELHGHLRGMIEGQIEAKRTK